MIRINLLAEERGKKGRSGLPAASTAGPPAGGGEGRPPMVLYGLILAAFICIGVGAWAYYFVQISGMETKIASQKKELEKYKGAREKVQQLEQKKAEFTEKLDQITQLKSRQSLPVKLMNYLVEVLPDGAWYTSLSVTNAGGVKAVGMARSIKTISTYYDNLIALPDFTNVQMGNIKKTSGVVEVYTFEITFTFVPGVPKVEEDTGKGGKKAPAKGAKPASKPAKAGG